MGDDSEEGSDGIAEHDDGDGDSSEDPGNNPADKSSSDVEIDDITFEPTGQLTIIAASNKKPAPASTSHGSGKMPQAPPDPQVDNSSDEDEDDDGEALILAHIIFAHNERQNLFR